MIIHYGLLPQAENLKKLVQCLDENMAFVQEERKRSLDEIRKSLIEQTNQPKNNALGMDGPLDLNRCGPSSLQCFSGEDHEYVKRKRAQQEQVKSWCAEVMIAKKKALDAEQRDEREYHNYVLEQDMIRSELETQVKRRRDERARLCQMENLMFAHQARQRHEDEMKADHEAQLRQTHYVETCPLVTEDTQLARNVYAEHRWRKDHFKGFPEEQVANIYRENESVAQERRAVRFQEAENEANWARYQAEMLSTVREADEARLQMKNEERRINIEILAEQKDELDNRKAAIKMERLPEIGTSFFFSRFGKSSR
jgi:hypothetical protein